MGLVIAVANQKGGVGKTTSAMNLGGAFHSQGYSVTLADADPQNSCLRWASSADETKPLPFEIVSIEKHGKMIGAAISQLAEKADIVIVDCPPSLETMTTSRVLLVADLTLIPTDSSPLDMWSSEGMMQLVERTRTVQPQGKYALFLNKSNIKTMLHSQMRALLVESNVHLLNANVKQREVYRVSAALGRTVFDVKGVRGAKEAKEEMAQVVAEIVEFMGEEEGAKND